MSNAHASNPKGVPIDSFFFNQTLVPRWGFLTYIIPESNTPPGQLGALIKKLKPYYIKSVKLPPFIIQESNSYTIGTSLVSQPKMKIDENLLNIDITFVEDDAGTVASFLTEMKNAIVDPNTGFYYSYEYSHPISIQVKAISGRGIGVDPDKAADRIVYIFSKCCIISVDAESYDYDSDQVVTYTAKFQATNLFKQMGKSTGESYIVT